MSELEAIREANRRFAVGYERAGMQAAPARRLAILTCMDARIDLERGLGLRLGDAHVVRNAGGRASDDAIRSLIISSHLLGTREIAVIHHTDCGLQRFSNDQLRRQVAEQTGADASQIDFLPFDDPRESVIEDVRRITATPQLDAGIVVSGHLYDVDSGVLEQVVAPARRGGGS